MALRRPGDAADLTRRGAGNRVSLRLGKWRAPTLADWPRVVLINGTPGRPVRPSDMVQVLSRPEPTRADRPDRPGLLRLIGGRSDELWRWSSFKGRAAAGQSTNTVRGVAIGPQFEVRRRAQFRRSCRSVYLSAASRCWWRDRSGRGGEDTGDVRTTGWCTDHGTM